ncbi:MAG: PRC-barrel domain-containing protein [Chloroflexota bacterium]
MADQDPDADQPIAWTAVPQDTSVRTSDGEVVGTLSDLLGSRQEDIFHGIVVHLGRFGHHVFVPADDVSLLTSSVVGVALTSDEIHALPVHDDERQFDLGIVGIFRKHPGWVREKDR